MLKIKENVTHQGIGGKGFVIDKEIPVFTIGEILDCVLEDMNVAMLNFIMRRTDLFKINENLKVYYGHVGLLGYFVAEDELENIASGDSNNE